MDTIKTYRILIVESNVAFLKLLQMVLFDLIQSYKDVQFIFEFSDRLSDSAKTITYPIGLAFIDSELIVHDYVTLEDMTKTNPNLCLAILMSDHDISNIQLMLKKLDKAPEKLVVGHIMKNNTTPNMIKASCMGFIDTMITTNNCD